MSNTVTQSIRVCQEMTPGNYKILEIRWMKTTLVEADDDLYLTVNYRGRTYRVGEVENSTDGYIVVPESSDWLEKTS